MWLRIMVEKDRLGKLVSVWGLFLSLLIPFEVTAAATAPTSRAASENNRGASDKLSRQLPLLGFHCAHNKREPWISLSPPISISLSVALSLFLCLLSITLPTV